MAEVAGYLGLPVSTVRAWAKGMGKTFHPVLKLPDPNSSLLSFVNLVEVHVLAALREQGHRLPDIRRAIQFVERTVLKKHPLATEAFLTDGVRIFVEHLGGLVDTKDGQFVLQKVVEGYLTRLDYGPDGLATRLYPFTRRGVDSPRAVVLNPLVSFGRPVLANTGVPTEEIADRFHAGEALDELALDFGVTREAIEEAIRCELHSKKAA
jgi:uncharacterized protein (DUF433 family)